LTFFSIAERCQIGRLTFIRHLGIPKRSGISQFRFHRVSFAMMCLYRVKIWWASVQ